MKIHSSHVQIDKAYEQYLDSQSSSSLNVSFRVSCSESLV